MITELGFTGGTGWRLVGAAAFAALAAAGVLVVEHHGGTPSTPTTVAAVTPVVSGRLVLETTFPVARWTVQLQGRTLAGMSRDDQHWEAEASGDGATIFVQAEPEDATSIQPVALRWTFAGRTGMLWGEGAVAGTLTHDGGGR